MDQGVRDSQVSEYEEISRECGICCEVIVVALRLLERADEC